MRQISIYALLVFIGAIIGGGVTWVFSYYPNYDYREDSIKIEDILKYSNVIITKDNFSCEGEINSNVGAVVGSIFESNRSNKRNRLTFGCYQNNCTLMVTNCMPSQSHECGNRILKFYLNEANVIQPDTFSCIDIP